MATLQVVRIRLKGPEASDFLNFVLKDETARIWCVYSARTVRFNLPALGSPHCRTSPGFERSLLAEPAGQTQGLSTAALERSG